MPGIIANHLRKTKVFLLSRKNTQRKRKKSFAANRTMQVQGGELRATLYSIGDAVISTDCLGRVTRMNPVAEQLPG